MGKPKRRSQTMRIDGEEETHRKRTNNAALITATLRDVMAEEATRMVIVHDVRKDASMGLNTDGGYWQDANRTLPTPSAKAAPMKIDSDPPMSTKQPSQILRYGPKPTFVKLTTNQGFNGVVKKRTTRVLTTKTQKRKQKGLERAVMNMDKVEARVTKQQDRYASRNALKRVWE